VIVSAAVPLLITLPAPLITPPKVVSAVLFAVSTALPSVTLPAPARLFAVWLKLFRSSVAPLATVTALLVAKAFATPLCSVPALISVGPE